ncbi:hypothetical protein ACFFGH_17525 [Lysobacter korlensis]|uniref:Uncharacterized protein n=1 Tax=Lysobacter korlensis TaxID=553636 RepID=A0ABV6RRN1_9GAMM
MAVQDHGRQGPQGGVEAGFAAARAMRMGTVQDIRGDTDETPVCGSDGHRCSGADQWLQAMVGRQSDAGRTASRDEDDMPVCGSSGSCARQDDAWLGRLLH